jgi:hypothetical protein
MLLWLAAMFIGCVHDRLTISESAYPATHDVLTPDVAVRSIVYDPSLERYREVWEAEVARRYDSCVLVLVHGDCVFGVWYAVMPGAAKPMTDLVAELRLTYPHDRIVLMSCNPCGMVLDAENVTYANADVWLVPDRVLDPRSLIAPDVIGNVYEFTEN